MRGAPTARFFRTGLHFFQKTLDLRAALWYNTECCHLGVAQLVARYLGVVEAASSSLVTQTKTRVHNEPSFFFYFLANSLEISRFCDIDYRNILPFLSGRLCLFLGNDDMLDHRC